MGASWRLPYVALVAGTLALAAHARAGDASCRPARPLSLQVQLAGGNARPALLRATRTPGLQLEDARTGQVLWTASAAPGASQRYADMMAPFGESLAAVHLDDDGLHDRLYAGDRAGRLWRFDLRAGSVAETWASGGIWADLSAPDGSRGFIAAPDITLMHGADLLPWLNVAIGSATIGSTTTGNRFHVLRDDAGPAPLPARITEADLLRLVPPLGIPASLPGATGTARIRGYYLDLGPAQVLAPSLTLEGRVHFTVVESQQPLASACADDAVPVAPVAVSVTVLRAEDGAAAGDANEDGRIDHRDLRSSLARAVPADAGVELAEPLAGRAACHVDGQPVPGCALDTRVRLRGWHREDAD